MSILNNEKKIQEVRKLLGEPTYIITDLAMSIGLIKAICLEKLYSLLNEKDAKIIADKRWVIMTYRQWKKQIPFLSRATIQRAFIELEKMEVVLSEYKQGMFKSYTIDYEKMRSLL